jgi:lipoyl(octanoyl) transferase
MLEEVMIRTSAKFGIKAVREAGKTGIWVPAAEKDLIQRSQSAQGEEGHGEIAAEKLGAIGVHISRWVTSHGFAYNVSTDLRNFDLIVPCGISGRKATSLEKLLGRAVSLNEIAPRIAEHFGEVFGVGMQKSSREELLEELRLAGQVVEVAV